MGLSDGQAWEREFGPCPITTSVAQQEQDEVNAIVTLLDDALLYKDVTVQTSFKSKPKEVLAVLIQLLVSKNLLTLQDVKRILEIKEKD